MVSSSSFLFLRGVVSGHRNCVPWSHHGGGPQRITGARRDNGNLQYRTRTFSNSHQKSRLRTVHYRTVQSLYSTGASEVGRERCRRERFWLEGLSCTGHGERPSWVENWNNLFFSFFFFEIRAGDDERESTQEGHLILAQSACTLPTTYDIIIFTTSLILSIIHFHPCLFRVKKTHHHSHPSCLERGQRACGALFLAGACMGVSPSPSVRVCVWFL